MSNYPKSKMDTFYYYDEEEPLETGYDCDVFIDHELISISYFVEGRKIEYSGSLRAPGIYELTGTDNCRAAIHRVGESRILYGDWKFEGVGGLWRIVLSNPQ